MLADPDDRRDLLGMVQRAKGSVALCTVSLVAERGHSCFGGALLCACLGGQPATDVWRRRRDRAGRAGMGTLCAGMVRSPIGGLPEIRA